MSAEVPTRTSTITVGVKRLLATAQFENLEIKLETTEEVMWSDLSERSKKINSITKVLTDQYQITQSQVLAELGVEEKRAWRKNKPQTSVSVGDELLG